MIISYRLATRYGKRRLYVLDVHILSGLRYSVRASTGRPLLTVQWVWRREERSWGHSLGALDSLLLRPLACLFPFIALQSSLYRVCGPIKAVWPTFPSVNSLHPMVPARGLLTVGDFSTCSFALIRVVDSAQNSPLISPVSPIKIFFIFSLPAMYFFLKTGTVAA